tara:strand:- start:589 stop:747 length:159 start_codon:yes stop_codon:yes gene_type:complete
MLAVFDIPRKPSSSKKEQDTVKNVAIETLDKLKAEKLNQSPFLPTIEINQLR